MAEGPTLFNASAQTEELPPTKTIQAQAPTVSEDMGNTRSILNAPGLTSKKEAVENLTKEYG